jgi:hypothetical protein
MRKAPQRVGKSASAIFFTLSNPMIPFYFAGEERGPGGLWRVAARNATCNFLSAKGTNYAARNRDPLVSGII